MVTESSVLSLCVSACNCQPLDVLLKTGLFQFILRALGHTDGLTHTLAKAYMQLNCGEVTEFECCQPIFEGSTWLTFIDVLASDS